MPSPSLLVVFVVFLDDELWYVCYLLFDIANDSFGEIMDGGNQGEISRDPVENGEDGGIGLLF